MLEDDLANRLTLVWSVRKGILREMLFTKKCEGAKNCLMQKRHSVQRPGVKESLVQLEK